MIHVTNALKVVGVDVKRKVFGEIHENLGGKLRIIVSAAAPIDAKIGKWVEDIGIVFLQGYGLTETAPISALTPEFQPKVGSAGKAIFQAELKIDNPNQNGEGEVLIKTPTLMLGYYEDEEATKEAIEVKEGQRWFHSGDVGYLDQDGFLYITGRSKNVIVTQNGGFWRHGRKSLQKFIQRPSRTVSYDVFCPHQSSNSHLAKEQIKTTASLRGFQRR